MGDDRCGLWRGVVFDCADQPPKQMNIGKYIASNVASLKGFCELHTNRQNGTSTLKALSSAMISLQRCVKILLCEHFFLVYSMHIYARLESIYRYSFLLLWKCGSAISSRIIKLLISLLIQSLIIIIFLKIMLALSWYFNNLPWLLLHLKNNLNFSQYFEVIYAHIDHMLSPVSVHSTHEKLLQVHGKSDWMTKLSNVNAKFFFVTENSVVVGCLILIAGNVIVRIK